MTEKTSILIVDDRPENLRLLSAMLEQTGYAVRSSTSALRALAVARREPPALILLDMRMPEMDGLAVCRELKADPALQVIPVIFISALAETEDKIKAFQAGGIDYITKPFQEAEVLARVTTHLALHRQKAELEVFNQRLKELESLRDSLTHMIVHDMRGPLSVINGHLGMIRLFESANLSGEVRDSLSAIQAGTTRLTRMVAEMLVVSKLEAGLLNLKLKPRNLVALARQLVADHRVDSDRLAVQINLMASPEPLTVSLDGELIERVLQNLLGNALKFSPGGSAIELQLAVVAGQARVAVRDFGPGIAPEFHQKVFEKFSQLESGKIRQGCGLGLAFCKLAIEAHGGRIGVDSQPGHGSTFWFTLPGVVRVT